MPGRGRPAVLLMIFTLLLAGCSASGGSDTAESGPVRLSFWSPLRGSQEMVDEYNRTHSKIQVDFEQVPSGDQGGWAKLSNAARAYNAPDVATIEYPQLPGFAIDGVPRDITTLLPESVQQADHAAGDGPHHLRRAHLRRAGRHRADGLPVPQGPVHRAQHPRAQDLGGVREFGPQAQGVPAPFPYRQPLHHRRHALHGQLRLAGGRTVVRHLRRHVAYRDGRRPHSQGHRVLAAPAGRRPGAGRARVQPAVAGASAERRDGGLAGRLPGRRAR